jgi:hypothetical protein
LRQNAEKQLCIRIDGTLYARVKKLADSRKMSVNKLAVESLKSLADLSLRNDMIKAYDLLSQDYDEADTERYSALQREVLDDGSSPNIPQA